MSVSILNIKIVIYYVLLLCTNFFSFNNNITYRIQFLDQGKNVLYSSYTMDIFLSKFCSILTMLLLVHKTVNNGEFVSTELTWLSHQWKKSCCNSSNAYGDIDFINKISFHTVSWLTYVWC